MLSQKITWECFEVGELHLHILILKFGENIFATNYVVFVDNSMTNCNYCAFDLSLSVGRYNKLSFNFKVGSHMYLTFVVFFLLSTRFLKIMHTSVDF